MDYTQITTRTRDRVDKWCLVRPSLPEFEQEKWSGNMLVPEKGMILYTSSPKYLTAMLGRKFQAESFLLGPLK